MACKKSKGKGKGNLPYQSNNKGENSKWQNFMEQSVMVNL